MKKLFAALALATFLTTGAAAYAHDGGDADAQPSQHHGMFDKLPPQDAQLIHDTMKKAHEDEKPMMAQAKKLHEDLKTILTADQFDEKAFVAAQSKLAALHDKIKAHMTAAFASALAQLPLDDRKIIADGMMQHHGWHHDKASWHGKAAGAADKSVQSN